MWCTTSSVSGSGLDVSLVGHAMVGTCVEELCISKILAKVTSFIQMKSPANLMYKEAPEQVVNQLFTFEWWMLLAPASAVLGPSATGTQYTEVRCVKGTQWLIQRWGTAAFQTSNDLASMCHIWLQVSLIHFWDVTSVVEKPHFLCVVVCKNYFCWLLSHFCASNHLNSIINWPLKIYIRYR